MNMTGTVRELNEAREIPGVKSVSGTGIGHNSGDRSISAEHLTSFVKRIERLNEEKAALGVDIREVYAEAKSAGFEPKIMRKVIAERARDPSDVAEEKALIEVYMRAMMG